MLLAMSKKCFPQFNKLPKTIVSKMNEAINKLRININGNGLNLEKIYNKYSDNLYSCRIDQEYRMILSFQQKTNTCIILWCDHHDEAYKWASNKKIDVNDITGTLQIYDVKENEIVMNNIGLRLFDKYSDEQLIAIGVPKLQLNFIRNIPSIEYFYDYKEAFSSDIYEYLELLINGNDYNEVLQLVNSLKDENVDNNYYNAAKRSSGEFAIIDDNKDLEKMNEWPLDKWRIFLHPCQKKIVKKDFFGPARVTGEAGTGKTVVAMHRAKYLLEKGNKVLFVTFTKNLCGDIENNLKKILDFDDIKNIKVKNIDSIIISYLKSNNKNRDLIYDEDKLLNYWQIAIEKSNKEIALDKHFFFEEWKSVVSLMDNLSLENYISSNRIGRKIRLDRKNRILIWQVFTNYIELMDNDNVFDIDYATFLARFLLRNENKKYYDSIIIDEGQDISSNAYKFFRLYAGDEHENDIFIVGDIHQRIYKNKAILSQCGISIRGKSNILRINYRTTQETRNFAMNILDGINFNEIDNENINTYPSVSLTHGEKPEIRNFDNLYEIANCFVEKLDKIIKDGYSLNDICVTFRKNSDINEFNAVLNEKNIATYIIDNNTKDDSNENGIRIATMHRIKGLEFRFVFIITSNLDLIKSNITNDDEIIERCLLYVAITRAQIKAYIFNNKDEKKEDETNNTNVDFEYIDENGTIKLIRCINEKECIILPEIIDGKKVETIGENCFKSLKKIKEIKFSNSIKYIEKMAFRNCSSLSNIELSDNIIEIGNNAFSGCKKLDSIILKSNNVLFSEKIINGTKKNFLIKIIGVVDLEKWRTSSKAHICCNYNYNYKYDNKDKTIIKSKEEFYYFLNENNEAIITKGKEEYNFTNQDIVIPSVIDNHIVKAIGMNAFENCTFKSMIISDDIKIISFHAFNKTKFIFLKFPRNLDYFDDNVFEESVYVSRYEVDSNKYRDGFIILMPYKINNIDIFKNKKIYVSNEEKNHQLNLLWEEKPTYNYDHLNICNGQVIYNCDLEMVYILKKDKEKYISIVYFCNFINGIPKVINDIKIFGWDNHFINQILDWRYDKPKLIEPLKIPSEIKYIYSLFNDKIYIHDDYYHLIELPRQLIVIENVISDRITIFLSKHIKIIRNCSCTFLIEENANFEGIDCNSNFLTNCSQEKNNGVFEYVIIEQKYVYIFNCVSESKIIELPSKIDDKLVLYCILFLEKNIDEFIINNIYVDENYLNFSIASDSYIKKVSIGKDIKTIKTLSNIFGCINFEFCQVKKNFYFQIYDGVEIINDTYFDEKIFDLKNTNIILPDSLKYVGKNSLICFNILHVEANKLTKFSPHSIYPNCVITFRKNKTNKMHDYGNLDNKLSFEEDETNN